MDYTINFWAVLVCAVISMAVGSIWYGPLFGRKFMALMGMDKLSKKEQDDMKKGMAKLYIMQFIASLVMFAVLAVFIKNLAMTSAVGGMAVALLLWIGIVVPLSLGRELWGGKIPLFWLGIGHMLVMLIIAGVILGAWQ